MRIAFLGNFGVDFSSESHHAKSLESLGHTVIRIQEPQPNAEAVASQAGPCDVFVWVHTHAWLTPGMGQLLRTFRQLGVPTLGYHLDLWLGISRQVDLETDEYWGIEHFFTADKNMAQWLNDNTEVKGHYMPAGVFGEECYLFGAEKVHDVIFVGSRGYHPEWQYRPQLIDWLHETYGNRFERYGGDGLGVVRGHALNALYQSTKVVVGDSLNIGFNYPDYSSDRLFETTGRGGFLIYPRIQGIADVFYKDGEEVVFYNFGDFDDLHQKIDYYLEHDEERECIRRAGYHRAKSEHTYVHRWRSILQTLSG